MPLSEPEQRTQEENADLRKIKNAIDLQNAPGKWASTEIYGLTGQSLMGRTPASSTCIPRDRGVLLKRTKSG